VSVRAVSSIVVLAAAATLGAQPGVLKSGFDVAEFDRSVRPQDDLFAHVNGRWLATTEIPSDRVFYGAFQELGAKVERDLHAIIEEVASDPDGWPARSGRQIADLYGSIMDEAGIERAGIGPVRPQLERIEAIATPAALAAEAGRLSATGGGGPFDGTVGDDPQNPGSLAVHLTQGGTLLPDRDHYLGADRRFVGIRAAYSAYLARIFAAAGRANAAADARALIDFETELARAQWTVAESRDPSTADGRYAKLTGLHDVPRRRVHGPEALQPSLERIDLADAQRGEGLPASRFVFRPHQRRQTPRPDRRQLEHPIRVQDARDGAAAVAD
jgi:putative endopeptidase